MRKMLLFILLIQAGMIGSQRAHAKGNPRLEKIERTDIWVANANQDDLPRILLIGGSIARGYFGAVEKDLAAKLIAPGISLLCSWGTRIIWLS